jgi:serine O-acetyltransferase
MVSAGAKVLGPLTIAAGSKIGAGSVVLKSVPPHSTVVGVPGRIVKQQGKRVSDMDQVKLPDPILEELKRLNDRIFELEKQAGIKTCRYSLTVDENNMRPENNADCTTQQEE